MDAIGRVGRHRDAALFSRRAELQAPDAPRPATLLSRPLQACFLALRHRPWRHRLFPRLGGGPAGRAG